MRMYAYYVHTMRLSACVNIVYVLCVLFSHVYNNVETPQFIADCGTVQIVLVRVVVVPALTHVQSPRFHAGPCHCGLRLLLLLLPLPVMLQCMHS